MVFADIMNVMMPYISLNKSINSVHNKFTQLNIKQLDKILSYLMKQKKMSNIDLTFSNYQIDNNLNPKLIIKNVYYEHIEYFCTLQADMTSIYLDIISHESFIKFIELNKFNRFLCIPVIFSPEYGNEEMGGHIGSLVIDNALEEIYLFDPNGKSNYFNYSFTNNITESDKYINLLFEKYFNDLELNYKFVSNYDKYVLNFYFGNNLIQNQDILSSANYQPSPSGMSCLSGLQPSPSGMSCLSGLQFSPSGMSCLSGLQFSGNCMIISLIICHYLMLTQKTLFDTIKDFYELSDNEFIDIISLYTVGLYELFQI
jgi:hypothetical protein